MNADEPLANSGGAPDFHVVIPSRNPDNLLACVEAIRKREPSLPPERIIVVDDGARAAAEVLLPGVRWIAGIQPFIYARNVNLGIRAAGTDVILLNDDAILRTREGFSRLAEQTRDRPTLGACSAAVRGIAGNSDQHPAGAQEPRDGTYGISFICVYLPGWVYQKIGPLDERFSGYGYDDNDYCTRILRKGLRLGIWDGCIVDHPGRLVSSYRSRPDFPALVAENQKLFVKKWGRIDVAHRAAARSDPARPRFSFRQWIRGVFRGEGS
ncbi:MAG TPA: glycosyltransferase [Chloroflexota bacterium]|nr:glycosyltransferase [Chloroflexota bacterium]